MPSATVCAWIETVTFCNPYATIVSYATSENIDEFKMGFYNTSTMSVVIKDQEYKNNVNSLDSGNKANIYRQTCYKSVLVSHPVAFKKVQGAPRVSGPKSI